MGRKSMAGKTSRTCTVGAKIIISSNFSLKLPSTVIQINFLPESVYIIFPREALNALRKIQFTIGTNFWNTLWYLSPQKSQK